MLIKIKRREALNKYPKFPLRNYDPIKDEEEYSYPNIFATYWLTLSSKSKRRHTQLLATELTRLIKDMGFENLIFLGDTEQYWISKLSLERNDYKPLNDALQYLTDNKVGRIFNGALEVNMTELPAFLKHFYCLTSCDASLPYFHFTDREQSFIGFIHYSGELRIDTLNKQSNELFLNVVTNTEFTIKPPKRQLT